MQWAIRRIMGRFYRFRSMFTVGFNILVFPVIVLSRLDLKSGWRRWYRTWRNNLVRFGGWITVRRWTSAFKKDAFSTRLALAKERLAQAPPRPRDGRRGRQAIRRESSERQ
jgi:hypothetical protein